MKKILPMQNGIFSRIDYEWRAEITASQLDFLFLAKYGKRNPSPVVDLVKEKYELEIDDELTSEAMQELANLLLMTYKNKWDKLSNVYDVEYDPIHNYLDDWQDESEGEHESTDVDQLSRTDTLGTTVQHTNTRTDNLTETRDLETTSELTRTDDLEAVETRDLDSRTLRTDNLSETKTYNSLDTREDDLEQHDSGASGSREHLLQGFNSTTYKESDKDIFTGNNSNTRTNTGTQENHKTGNDTIANSGTQTVTGEDNGTVTTANTGTQESEGTVNEDGTIRNTGTQQNVGSDTTTGTNSRASTTNRTGSGTESTSRSGRHMGNIGNLTSQQQLREEIDLWKWNFVDEVLKDAKDFFCLDTYLNY